MAGASPRSVSSAGWMPRASSRSSSEASPSASATWSRNGPAESGSFSTRAAGHPDLEREADEALLRAVVEVALDPAPRVVGGLHDPRPRGAQLVGAGLLDLAPPQRLLGPPPLGDVEDRAVAPHAAAGARHELAAVEHPADLAVGAHDPVLERERLPVGVGLGDGLEHVLVVVGVDDAHQRAAPAGQEVGGRIAGDALDLVADQLERVVRVPGRAVDGARHVLHHRPHQRVVGALLGGAQAGAGAREQLGAGERPVQVVVGAGVEHRVGHPALGLHGDRQQPGLLEPRVLAQRAADVGGVELAGAVDDHEVGGRLVERPTRLARRPARR